MTNSAFRYFYPSGWDNPKRRVMPPIDNAENTEHSGNLFFTPCLFNNDSTPDYFITIWPKDLANGCGSASASAIHFFIVSDGENYRLHTYPLRRQYKALQCWFASEYEMDADELSPWIRINTVYKQKDTVILKGLCYNYYSKLGAEFTTRIVHPGTPQEWGYTTLDCKEYAHVYYYLSDNSDSLKRHWTTTLYH